MGYYEGATGFRKNMVLAFQNCYANLNKDNIESGWLDKIYDENMVFEDSFHRIQGLDHFRQYCANLYSNVLHTQFEFHEHWAKENSASMSWTLNYAHPKLVGGKVICVPGSSVIHFDDKITYHRDYFDGGAMLYEQLPVLGKAVQFFKQRLDS